MTEIQSNSTPDKAVLIATGDFSLMNFWMALLPSSKSGENYLTYEHRIEIPVEFAYVNQ